MRPAAATGPLFRRYATRSLEESRGLVPPYANGCDEVLSIRKVPRVFGVATCATPKGIGSGLFSVSGWSKYFLKFVTGFHSASYSAPAATTVKPLVKVATSVPVVAVTFRVPGVAAALIVMMAVALVALFTVRLFTVIPAPKLATVVP